MSSQTQQQEVGSQQGHLTGASVQGPDARGAEAVLARRGVFKGADGLRRIAECQAFWDEHPYGTRLYFEDAGDGYLHRDVLRSAVDALDLYSAAIEVVRKFVSAAEESESTLHFSQLADKFVEEARDVLARATRA